MYGSEAFPDGVTKALWGIGGTSGKGQRALARRSVSLGSASVRTIIDPLGQKLRNEKFFVPLGEKTSPSHLLCPNCITGAIARRYKTGKAGGAIWPDRRQNTSSRQLSN